MVLNLGVSFSFGWTTLLAFLAGIALTGLFWFRARKESNRRKDQLVRAIRALVEDSRPNSLVGNIVKRIEDGRGGQNAVKDFTLIDRLVRGAFVACEGRASGLGRPWQGFRERVFETMRQTGTIGYEL